jgi:hypothetical protein
LKNFEYNDEILGLAAGVTARPVVCLYHPYLSSEIMRLIKVPKTSVPRMDLKIFSLEYLNPRACIEREIVSNLY